jgi:hypothetical protein
MIQDHTRVWLLRPGFTLEQFGQLPDWLDETSDRPGAEQLGMRWQPVEGSWGFRRYNGADSDAKLWNGERGFELLGAVHLRNELLMVFEDDVVAIVASSPAYDQPAMQVGRVERFADYNKEAAE